MKLRYQKAVVSYCRDLTDPKATSLPIAVLVVGEDDDVRRIAGLFTRPLRLPNVDPITAEFLSSTSELLKQHIDQALGPRNAPLDTLIRRLSHALRNSLHVSIIGGVQEQSVSDSEEVYPALVRLLMQEGFSSLPPAATRQPIEQAWGGEDFRVWRPDVAVA